MGYLSKNKQLSSTVANNHAKPVCFIQLLIILRIFRRVFVSDTERKIKLCVSDPTKCQAL